MGLLDGGLQSVIGGAMQSLFLPATLTRRVPGVAANAFTPATTTNKTYPCKAIVETYSVYYRANNMVTENDRRIMILAKGLAITPQPDDLVAIGGRGYKVMTIETDPATAVYTCRCSI